MTETQSAASACGFQRFAGPGLLVVAALALLAGCLPVANTAVRKSSPPVQSTEAREYYTNLEERLKQRGLLKTNGGADAGFDATSLATNFERIALYDEYQVHGRNLVRVSQETRIRRWEGPVRVAIQFGESVPEGKQAQDTQFILDYLDRLRHITGHRIEVTRGPANFYIFILDTDEISNISSRLSALKLPSSDLVGSQIARLPVDTLCSVFAITESSRDFRYLASIVVIKAEHPDLLRQACYHEEIAQGMGLTNDSLKARPSIFNDNEEYALLTFHDELLLRMLYDPRIRSGMPRLQAMPVIQMLARELRPGSAG